MTVRGRLITLFLAPLVALLLVLGGAFGWTSARSIAQEFTSQQVDDLSYFLVSARQALSSESTTILAGELARYSELYGASVGVYSRAGTEFLVRGPLPDTVGEQIDLALSGRRSEPVQPVLPWALGPATVVEPVFSDGRVIGAVVVASPLDGPRTAVITQWLLLAAASLILVALCVFVILRLVRWVLQPMLRVDGAMAAIEQGEMGARIDDDTGPPEMQRMIRMFNSMADEIERVIARQQEFALNASHELRNPLGALLLRVEYLATGLDESWEDDVEKTREEGQRMARILDTLLTLARTQRRDEALAPVDLAVLAHDRAAAWQAVARERGVTVSVHVGEGERAAGGRSADWGRVVTDRTAIESALDGVIDNALKFAPRCTPIDIAVSAAGAGYEISVRDRGPGLGEAEIEHATDRFWRSSRDQNVSGSGLGLAIAHDLLRALGGGVRVTSPDGGGLRVALQLPAEPPAGLPATAVVDAAAAAPGAQPSHVKEQP